MQAITLQLHSAIKSKAYNIKWDCIRRAQQCQRIGGTEQQQVSPPPLHNAQQLCCEPRGSSPLGREDGRKKQRLLYHSGLHGYGRSPAPAVGKECHKLDPDPGPSLLLCTEYMRNEYCHYL